jgi:hypothetical protein
MKKVLLASFCLITAINSIKAQNYHEVGIGFSGMRIWEINPPSYIKQDLDYYYSPHFSYNYYFKDEKFVLGFAAGLVY